MSCNLFLTEFVPPLSPYPWDQLNMTAPLTALVTESEQPGTHVVLTFFFYMKMHKHINEVVLRITASGLQELSGLNRAYTQLGGRSGGEVEEWIFRPSFSWILVLLPLPPSSFMSVLCPLTLLPTRVQLAMPICVGMGSSTGVWSTCKG